MFLLSSLNILSDGQKDIKDCALVRCGLNPNSSFVGKNDLFADEKTESRSRCSLPRYPVKSVEDVRQVFGGEESATTASERRLEKAGHVVTHVERADAALQALLTAVALVHAAGGAVRWDASPDAARDVLDQLREEINSSLEAEYTSGVKPRIEPGVGA